MPELVFIHIPKTAGLSFLHSLNEVYGEENVKQIWDLIPYHDSILHETDSVFYRDYAHARNVILDSLQSAPDYKVLFGHMPAFVIDGLYPDAKWVTWLRQPVDQVLSRVFHFRKMRINKAHWLSPWSLAKMPLFQNCQFFYTGGSLERFSFVGVLERYEECFRMLCNLMEWGEVKPQHLHVTGFEEDKRANLALTPEFFMDVKRNNLWDFMLYNQVANGIS